MSLLESLRGGKTFASWDEVERFIEDLAAENHFPLRIKDSKTIEAYNRGVSKWLMFTLCRLKKNNDVMLTNRITAIWTKNGSTRRFRLCALILDNTNHDLLGIDLIKRSTPATALFRFA